MLDNISPGGKLLSTTIPRFFGKAGLEQRLYWRDGQEGLEQWVYRYDERRRKGGVDGVVWFLVHRPPSLPSPNICQDIQKAHLLFMFSYNKILDDF